MNCDEALHELELFLDGEIEGHLRVIVEEHLGSCSPCFDRGEFRRKLRVIVREKCSTVEQLPPHLAERIRAAIVSQPD